MQYEIMLTGSEVFLNISGHILDIHRLRMYILRNCKDTAEFCSKEFSGSWSPLNSKVM